MVNRSGWAEMKFYKGYGPAEINLDFLYILCSREQLCTTIIKEAALV